MENLQKYLPQKMFLLQGDEKTLKQCAQHHIGVEILNLARFTMDDAKNLVARMQETTGAARTMIIYFSIFSPDAAEVMLKAVEEPEPMLTLVLITPHPFLVPQTIRSRVLLLGERREAADALIPKTAAAALAYIKSEFDSDSAEAATLRAKAVTFLDALETSLRTSPKKAQYVYKAKHLLFKGNLPTKQVLEYVVTMTL